MALINEEVYQNFVKGMKERRIDLVHNSEAARKEIAIFDGEILIIASRCPNPAKRRKLAGSFFVSRNCLARHIGAPVRDWADYERELSRFVQ